VVNRPVFLLIHTFIVGRRRRNKARNQRTEEGIIYNRHKCDFAGS
jgi:hypothetical protein